MNLVRGHAESKRAEMPDQASKHSKTLNQHKLRKQNIRVSTQNKRQDSNHLITKPKETHIHVRPHTKPNIKGTSSHLSLISLNINGLISPMKRHMLIDLIHKQVPAL